MCNSQAAKKIILIQNPYTHPYIVHTSLQYMIHPYIVHTSLHSTHIPTVHTSLHSTHIPT